MDSLWAAYFVAHRPPLPATGSRASNPSLEFLGPRLSEMMGAWRPRAPRLAAPPAAPPAARPPVEHALSQRLAALVLERLRV